MSEQPGRRVRVVSPRARGVRTRGPRAVRHDIGEQTVVGEVFMASLVRIQLRLAIGVLLIFTVLLGGLPLLFAVEPRVSDIEVIGLPLPWVVLGAAVYPVLIVGAWFYVRQAERNESDFADLVERS